MVMAATESQAATVCCDADGISASRKSGNTTWKQPASRFPVSSMGFCSPQLAHRMIEVRTRLIELCAPQAELCRRLVASDGCKKLLQRAVLGGGHKVEINFLGAGAFKQHLKRLLFDTAGKGAATHDPGFDHQTFSVDRSGHHGDGSARFHNTRQW